LRLRMDMKAITKKAMPAQVRLSVRNQTTTAIMAAGKKKSRTLAIITIMMRPTTNRNNNAIISNRGGKVGRGMGGILTVL